MSLNHSRNDQLISIIVPYFGYSKGAMNLIESISKQTYKNIEIIFVDDCSLQPLEYKLNEPKVKIFRNEKNLGPGVSRNIGMGQASGELLLFTDHDCELPSNWVENYKNKFESNPQINIMCSGVKIRSETVFGALVAELGYPAGGNLGFEKMWKVDRDSYVEHFSGCNFAIRKSLMKKINFSDLMERAGCEDNELSFRLQKNKEKIFFLKENFLYHEETASLKKFCIWHFDRGRATVFLKRSNVDLKPFYMLRIWSMKNVILQKTLFRGLILTALFFLQLFFHFIGKFYQRSLFYKTRQSLNKFSVQS